MGIMKAKMIKDIVPEGCTMMLALVDALQVFFFAGSMFLIGQRFSRKLFMLGAWLSQIEFGDAGIDGQ